MEEIAPPSSVAAPKSEESSAEELRYFLCGLLVLLGSVVIIGWILGVSALTAIVPGYSTMKFNASVAFVFTGVGLALAGRRPPRRSWLALAAGLVVTAIGASTLIEYVAELDLGIDQAVVADRGPLSGSGYPGRMSVLTAAGFTALGPAVLMLGLARSRGQIVLAHALAFVPGAAAVIAGAGYAFGAEAFWGIGRYTAIAVHTILGLLVATAAALMTRAQDGWLQPYVDSPAARALLVRLLPLALLVPVALGAFVMLGAALGAYNAPYGFALFIPAMAIALVVMSLWVAAKQREAELIRLRYERHLQLVVAELNHRVKNTLAIVQSFAHQSLKGASSASAAGAAFEGRLTALASAHRLLTRENWDQVSLVELIAHSLEAHDDQQGRFTVEGPDMMVSPKTSVTMAMTLHELATNSLKYGALSSPDGRVRIHWETEGERFRFRWEESGGPACKPPATRGFGSRMLQRALASELDGRAELIFSPEGFAYLLEAPARSPL